MEDPFDKLLEFGKHASAMEDPLDKLLELGKDASAAAQKLADRYADMLQPITDSLSKIFSSLTFRSPLADMPKGYSFHVKPIWEALDKHLVKEFRSLTPINNRVRLLWELGWMVPLRATPIEYKTLIDSITDINSADSIFTAYYLENDMELLKDMKNNIYRCHELSIWFPAFDEAFIDLNEQRHRSCTALLLPLIEGIILYSFSSDPYPVDPKRVVKNRLKSSRPESLKRYL